MDSEQRDQPTLTPGAASASNTLNDSSSLLDNHDHAKRATRSNPQTTDKDAIDDFRRTRTKFTAEQLNELEALFVTHGPHPTREQRASLAEKIGIPPRTVQIFLQNRRQREMKNKNATISAQLAKDEAKNAAMGCSTSVLEFTVPVQGTVSNLDLSAGPENITDVVDTVTLASKLHSSDNIQLPSLGNMSPPSSLISSNSSILYDHQSRHSTISSSSALHLHSSSSNVKNHRLPRPSVSRTISLDQVAERMESSKNRPLSKGIKSSVQQISSNPPSSPITESCALDEEKTPIKRAQTHTFGFTTSKTTPPAAALWTRMISSPPTPLSPANRDLQGRAWVRATHMKSSVEGTGTGLSKSSSLELACAKARVSDQRSKANAASRLMSAERTIPTGASDVSPLHKRLREDIENELPRKRSSAELSHQRTSPELKPSNKTAGMKTSFSSASPPSSQIVETIQATQVTRTEKVDGSWLTDSTGSSFVSSEEEVATPSNSLPPSSPIVSDFSHSHFPKAAGRDRSKGLMTISNLISADGKTDGYGADFDLGVLSEHQKQKRPSSLPDWTPLEEDAARILASFFGAKI